MLSAILKRQKKDKSLKPTHGIFYDGEMFDAFSKIILDTNEIKNKLK